MDARALAARTLELSLQEGKNLETAMAAIIPAVIDARERAFIKELCYGVMRWYYRLDYYLCNLLNKPLRRKDLDIRILLLCGLYQMGFMRTPAHAAVSATVSASAALNKNWAKQLINAVLRRYQRDAVAFEQSQGQTEQARFAHPQWLITAIRDDWPAYWQDILEANNRKPPMYLRVNLRKLTRAEYLQSLSDHQIKAVAVDGMPCAVKLERPVDVEALPGFSQGHVSVQDLGAQYAVTMLNLLPGLRVLDACAAPGGKCTHIYETQPALAGLTAVDADDVRLQRLQDNCRRLGIAMEVIHADVADPESWWNGLFYDRILLDVPCSATGVIRRHPDIKILRQEDDIRGYIDRQYRLLSSAWPILNRNGRLLYATCSVLARENDLQIEKFLENHPDAEPLVKAADWGITCRYGVQSLPGIGDADGFYYAVLEKR